MRGIRNERSAAPQLSLALFMRGEVATVRELSAISITPVVDEQHIGAVKLEPRERVAHLSGFGLRTRLTVHGAPCFGGVQKSAPMQLTLERGG